MVMGDAKVKPHPKNGIESSSFLATKDSGGKMKLSARVSQVEECFDMTMCGSRRGGMFSAPTMRCVMPQIHRAARRLSQHHPVMNRYRGTGGSQNISSTRIA